MVVIFFRPDFWPDSKYCHSYQYSSYSTPAKCIGNGSVSACREVHNIYILLCINKIDIKPIKYLVGHAIAVSYINKLRILPRIFFIIRLIVIYQCT